MSPKDIQYLLFLVEHVNVQMKTISSTSGHFAHDNFVSSPKDESNVRNF